MVLKTIDVSDKISVVIITYNRVNSIERTLAELDQLPEKFPIIVVDNNSSDGTAALIRRKFPDVQLHSLPKNMGALGRNIGVGYARTPYIAFSDDDSWWEAGALSKAIKYFEQYPKVGAIAGQILVNDDRKLDPTSALQSISPINSHIDMPGPAILGFLGCQLIIRKEVYQEAGGYSEHLYFSGEEGLLALDILANGWGITYCADIIGRHYPSPIRDIKSRYRLGARNKILRAWLRRPIKRAVLETLRPEIHHPGALYDALGIFQGLLTLPKIWPHRKVVPWWVEWQIRTIEDQNEQLANKAKQKQYEYAQSLQWKAG